MTKTHMTKNFHKKNKYILTTNAPPPQKNQCPIKISPQSKYTSIHNYQNFSIAMQKIPTSKIKKIPTSSCPYTNKFSHSQNHNHKIFQAPTSHTQQKFSYLKFYRNQNFSHAHAHKILPCP